MRKCGFVLVLGLAIMTVAGNFNKAEAAPAAPPVTMTVDCDKTPLAAAARQFCATKKAAEEAAKLEKKCTDAAGEFDAKTRKCDFSAAEKKACEAGLDDGSNGVSPGTVGVWNPKTKACVFDGTRTDLGFCLPAYKIAGEGAREIHNDYSCWVYDAARNRRGSGVSKKTLDAVVNAQKDIDAAQDKKIGALEKTVGDEKGGLVLATGVLAKAINGEDYLAPPDDGSTEPKLVHRAGLLDLVNGRDVEVPPADGSTDGPTTMHVPGLIDNMYSLAGHATKTNARLGRLEASGLVFSIGGGGFLASGNELKAKVGDKSQLVRGSYLRGGGVSLGLDYEVGRNSPGLFVSISTATSDGASKSGSLATFDGSYVVAGAQYLRWPVNGLGFGGFAAFQTTRVGSLLLTPRGSGMGAVGGFVGRVSLGLGESWRLFPELKLGVGYETAAAPVTAAGQTKPVSGDGLMLYGSLELRLGYKPN